MPAVTAGIFILPFWDNIPEQNIEDRGITGGVKQAQMDRPHWGGATLLLPSAGSEYVFAGGGVYRP